MLYPVLGAPTQERCRQKRVLQRVTKIIKVTQAEAEGAGPDYDEDKGWRDLINMYKYLMGACKDKGATLFSVVSSRKMRDEAGSPESLWNLHPRGYSKPNDSPVRPALAEPASGAGVKLDDLQQFLPPSISFQFWDTCQMESMLCLSLHQHFILLSLETHYSLAIP